MATFVMFGRYTTNALKGISAERTQAATKVIGDSGGEVKAAYALLGEVDLLLIVDFPSTEQALKASVELAKLTGIAFTTAPAITAKKFDKLVG